MNGMEWMLRWLQDNAGRIIWLAVVLILAVIVTRGLGTLLRRVLDRSNMPSASIFINIMRVVVWASAMALVLQPVFGINPTTIITALGVGGVALSLGLKDTIANVISGFGLMFGKVIQPGDLVDIGGTVGIVKDVTWRHTVIAERNGNDMVIPNSQLNTAQLEKLTAGNEACVDVAFIARPDADFAELTPLIVARVAEATQSVTLENMPPLVRLVGATPFGLEGRILVFAASGVVPGVVRDLVVRSIAGESWLSDMSSGGSRQA